MSRSCARPLLRLAVLGALAAALALGACGRKGPLDLPPGASGEYPRPNLPGIVGTDPRASAIGGEQAPDGNPGVGPDGQPRAPKGANKRIPLDVLLN